MVEISEDKFKALVAFQGNMPIDLSRVVNGPLWTISEHCAPL